MGLEQARSCLPASLHPFSAKVFNLYASGLITTGEFLRWFHMPNSDYLPLGVCIVHQVEPRYVPGKLQPEILNAFIRS